MSHWSLGKPHEGNETPYDRFWGEAERRRHRIWLWVAALLMAGIAMASMVQTEFWNQVSDRLLAPPANKTEPVAVVALPGSLPELAVDNEILPVPAQAPAPGEAKKPAVVKPQPVVAPKPAAAKPQSRAATPPPAVAKAAVVKAAVVKPAVVMREARPSTAGREEPKQKVALKAKAATADEPEEDEEAKAGRFAVDSQPEANKLTIPFEGSNTEAGHYLLAEPDGVAINLPNGRPTLGTGHFAVNRDGFRAIWVRERRGGSQVRVFFSAQPATRPKVSVSDGQISISLSR